MAKKTRSGDYKVEVELPKIDYRDRDVVLVDDIASSGQTLANAARGLNELKVKSVSVLVTHALFAAGAEAKLLEAGVQNIWSTDSVIHDSNCIHPASLVTNAVTELLNRISLPRF